MLTPDNPECSTEKLISHSNDISTNDVSSDEDIRDESLESTNGNETCPESPYQSLEWEYFTHHLNTGHYFDNWMSGLCCVENDVKGELTSKTIKAAINDLTLKASIETGSCDTNEVPVANLHPNDVEVVNSAKESERSRKEMDQRVESSLQFRRRQTRERSLRYLTMESRRGTEPSIPDHTKAPTLSLQLTRIPHSSSTSSHFSSASPTERHQFFKSLSNLVRCGQEKGHNTVCSDDKLSFKMVHHFLWLELLAWHRDCSINELESVLSMQREAVPTVISEVLNFSVRYNKPIKDESSSNSAFEVPPLENGMENKSPEVKGQSDDAMLSNDSESEGWDCPCSDTMSQICQNCVDKTTSAMQQVEAIIHKTDHIESLYPSLKALSESYPECNSRGYLCRVKTLNLWLNITKDLQQKISLLAKRLGVKNRLKAGWPRYDGEDEEDGGEQEPRVDTELCTSKPSHQRIKFAIDLGMSPSTSNSDHSDISKESFPSSPEVQLSNPLEFPKQKTNVAESSEDYVRAIYHRYVDRTLKHKGLKWMYKQLLMLLRPILYRVHATLRKSKSKLPTKGYGKVVSNQRPFVQTPDTALPVKLDYLEELSAYGVRAKCFQLLHLPKFHQPFFFLLRVLLDVIHECLRLRLEQLPAKPSALSVGQLIKECKEVLKAATQTRRKYINLAQTVRGEGGNEIIETELDSFDFDLQNMLELYLGYLHHRMLLLQDVSKKTLHQKSYLEEEWSFVSVVCPHIPSGEASASKKFCLMASHLLNSIGLGLSTAVSEHISTFQQCYTQDSNESSSYRKNIALQTYRNIKHEFQDSSERARQVITLAKSLRKDLEIATEFSLRVPCDVLLAKLKETGHIRVTAPNFLGHVMFVPGNLLHCQQFIWQLVDMTCGHEALDAGSDEAVYLVIMQCSRAELKGLFWDGPTLVLEPSAEANITLSHVEVDGLLLVVNHSSQLVPQCRKFQKVMGKTLHVAKQETTCNHIIADALDELKSDALELWQKLTLVVQEVEETLNLLPLYGLDYMDQISYVSSYRDVVHQGYKFAFEYQKAVTRLITGEARNKFYSSLASFAELWMRFVVEKCEEGRGTKPMWVKQGLHFLIAVYDSPFGHSLSEEEFESVQSKINNSISHLSGSAERSPVVSQSQSPKSGALSALRLRHQRIRTSLSASSSDSLLFSPPSANDAESKRKRSRDETVSKNRNGYEFNGKTPAERVRSAIELLDSTQEEKLFDKRVIGQVSNVKIRQTPLHLSMRTVPFPWQRCFKIGEGRFGKVYTAVNNTTGELIAMKEIRLQPNDHRAIKEALDEIRTFEGIKHPHLVRYYGVEVHREEMLIFMEYCNEGSLESAVQLHLPEPLIRKYTSQLLDAVNVLHENSIVHRDIKSANIFLTSDGNLKLGDFGSSIKLKNNTTMPGELCGFVGTPAYMAPEVFTKNIAGGHGRAADVWSIGCVVLEMFTAQRPWYDLENSYQIMFTVGMGNVPEIPDSVSDEGEDFLCKCLQHDPVDRWSTSQLLSHPFTKVQEEFR